MKTITKSTKLTVLQIERNYAKIEDDRLYTAQEIEAGRFFIKCTAPQVYRLAQRGKIKAITEGTEKKTFYLVAGKELKSYIKSIYPFIRN